MKTVNSFLGRYENKPNDPMSQYLEVVRSAEGGYEYSYGIGAFAPIETSTVETDDVILARIANAVAKGFRKVKTAEELKEARELEATASGFDFLGWMAKRS